MERLRRRQGRPRHPDILTPAEWAVVELVREGLTNAEIAVQRGVGPETVKSQVSSILSKLSLPDRQALASWQGQLVSVADQPQRWWGLSALVAWLAVPKLAKAFGVSAAVATAAIVAVAIVALDADDDTPAGRIAFTSDRDGVSEIYLINPDGSDLARLTNTPADVNVPLWLRDVRFPTWSPDRVRLAYSSGFDLYVVDTDESDPASVLTSPTGTGWPAWSPDGSRIAVISGDRGLAAGLPGARNAISIINADGSAPTNLSRSAEGVVRAVWSPDGSRIAALVKDATGLPREGILMVNPDGSHAIHFDVSASGAAGLVT
jgi:DNA-binding CsgD family transcriptional regulator